MLRTCAQIERDTLQGCKAPLAAPWGGSIISCQFVSFLLCHSWASAAAAACKTPLCKLRLLRRSMALIALKSINAFYAFREFLLFALEYWTTLKKAAEIVRSSKSSYLQVCRVLGISNIGADRHFWVKTRFGILVKGSWTWANQVWPRAILTPKNDQNSELF